MSFTDDDVRKMQLFQAALIYHQRPGRRGYYELYTVAAAKEIDMDAAVAKFF